MASNREKGASGPDLDGVAIGNIMDNSGALRKNKVDVIFRRKSIRKFAKNDFIFLRLSNNCAERWSRGTGRGGRWRKRG